MQENGMASRSKLFFILEKRGTDAEFKASPNRNHIGFDKGGFASQIKLVEASYEGECGPYHLFTIICTASRVTWVVS